VSFASSQADYLTLSAHKMGGPKGVGAILIREGLVLESTLAGGHQERGRRPGTENVPALAGLEAFARLLQAQQPQWTRALEQKRSLFLAALDEAVGPDRYVLRGDQEHRLANTLNLAFAPIDGEDLLMALDLEGIAASSGSACTAGSVEPSAVILAMGFEEPQARQSIRISFGPMTSEDELQQAAETIGQVVRRLDALATGS
jgi:cysteine desulfurase